MKFDNAYMNDDGVLTLEKSTGEESGYSIVVSYIEETNSTLVFLYRIPLYGGHERLEGTFLSIEDAVKEAESWA